LQEVGQQLRILTERLDQLLPSKAQQDLKELNRKLLCALEETQAPQSLAQRVHELAHREVP